MNKNEMRKWAKSIDMVDDATISLIQEKYGPNIELFELIERGMCLYYWCVVSKWKLSKDFIRRFCYELDWDAISYHQKLSEDSIREFQNYVNWDFVSLKQTMSEPFMEEFINKLNWVYVIRNFNISETFLRKLMDSEIVSFPYINGLAKNQKLSEKFIYDYRDCLNWNEVMEHQKMSEKLVETLLRVEQLNFPKDKLFKYKFSEYGIIRNVSFIGWKNVCKYQNLSESFIEAHENNVCWNYIARHQKLSINFIRKHIDKFEPHNIVLNTKCENIPPEIIFDDYKRYAAINKRILIKNRISEEDFNLFLNLLEVVE